MNLNLRIETFVKLGNRIAGMFGDLSNENSYLDSVMPKDSNEWFTSHHVKYSLMHLSSQLDPINLSTWLKKYSITDDNNKVHTIGLVTAGNIPLVGFHDVLCILLSGNKLLIKHSSKDEKLMAWVLQLIIEINPEFSNFIRTEKEQLKNFDAIIATGSDNTARYFEYYFKKYPNIIRKNRNSIAILTGNETDEELEFLADDILLYFGLGCRNVSKIFIPGQFNLQRIFKAVFKYQNCINHNKFANNYIYNKSIYLMNSVPFLENGFLIVKEDEGMDSPIAVLFYEKYKDIRNLKDKIEQDREKIQCIVSKHPEVEDKIGFGEAQKPNLWDYADNVDTMNFLISLDLNP